MKKLLFVLVLIASNAMGQLNVNTSATLTQMVQNFIGSGVTVTNVTYTGGVNSRGIFSNGGTTNLGLNSGVVLCTGQANTIPNPASYFMSSNLGLPGDANLNSINNGCLTYDASILEFDFTPTADTVSFRYVFGSEEYPNYICSQYNDVFAFFVTGPNPLGGNYTNFNMALIPGTTIPVSVNSVNSGTPGPSYNAGGCLSLSYSNYFVNNAALGGTTIAFGGMTKPLIAKCKVVPCQTYHLKMAVADGYNGLYDSGVFLEANSFSASSFSVHNVYTSNVLGNNAIEGCSDGRITFVAPNPVNTALTINYTVGGTAINGTDYTNIPSSITIPAGQDSVSLIIHPLLDGITEGGETVILNINNGCTTVKDTIYIIDNLPLTVNAGNDTSICTGNPVTLTALANGGIAPLTYHWSQNAGSVSQVSVSPLANTTYAVTVTDNCAASVTDSVNVTINPGLTIAVNAQPSTVCLGQTTTLTASGADTYVWQPGNLAGASINVSPNATNTYTVIGNSNGCLGTDSVKVNVGNLNVSVTSTNENCGHADGSASAVVTGSCQGNYVYDWNTLPSQSTAQIQNLSAGTYTVTVSCGVCTGSASVDILNTNGGVVANFIANPQEVTVDNGLVNLLDISSGNINSWVWSLGDGTIESGTSINHLYGQAGIYPVTLIVKDAIGCTDSVTKNIIVRDLYSLYIPNCFTPNGDTHNEKFAPRGTNIDPNNFSMFIFDRWGGKMFETHTWTDDTCEGWDGTLNNSGYVDKARMGVYIYKIHAGNVHEGYQDYIGKITIIP